MFKYVNFILLITVSTFSFSQKLQETRKYNTPKTVKIDGRMTIRLHQAKNVEIVIETEKVSLKDIYTKYSDNELLIRVEPLNIKDGKVVINAYLPSFSELSVARGAITHLGNNLLKDKAKITVKSGATVKSDINSNKLTATIKSGAFLELKGTLKELDASIHSGSILRTDNLQLLNANIKTQSGGFAAINPTSSANLKASTGGDIKLLRPVKNLNVKTSLKGSIIYAYDE